MAFTSPWISSLNRIAARPEDSPRSGRPPAITARGKHVIVVGGGDTGSDCVGTSIRQRAASVTQIEILPKTARREEPGDALARLAEDHAHFVVAGGRLPPSLERVDEGTCAAENGCVRELSGCEVQWVSGPKGWQMQETPGTEFTLPAQLVLIAMGFLHVVRTGVIEELGLQVDGRGNVVVNRWMASQPGVFAAGDTVRGASLVVHAINQGRLMATAADNWLRQ